MVGLVNPQFPSHEERVKDKKWIQKYAKACWDDFHTIDTNSFYKGRVRYSNIKKFMIGEQDVAPYIELLNTGSANKNDKWLKAFKEILPIIPKFRRMAISTLIKNLWEIKIQSVDPTAIEQKKDFYANNLARMELAEQFKRVGLDPSEFIPKADGDFQSKEELDIFMKYSYKDQMAIEAEEVLKLILTNNDFDAIREDQIEQLHDLDFIGYHDSLDLNGDVKIEGIDVRDVIVSRCKEKDFSDSIYRGVVKDYSLSGVKGLDVDRELTEDDYVKIYDILKSKNTSYEINTHVDPVDYENERCQVMIIEFDSKDFYFIEKGKDKNGNTAISRKKNLDKGLSKDNEYETKEYPVIYEAKWIVGTDVYFGCRLQTNMKRAANNLNDVKPSFHFFSTMLHNMNTKSMGENYISIANVLQIAWMKYQDVIASARKKGYSIEVGSLENVPIGKGGVAFKPHEMLDFIKQTGIVVYRRLDEKGQAANYRPIEELNNGLGDEASRYFNEVQNCISILQQLSGFNEITDGSTPDSRTLNGVAKLASESTNNSIDFLKRGQRRAFIPLGYSLLIRVQDIAKDGRITNYIDAIGEQSTNFFKLNPDTSARELGMIVTDAPSEFEKQDLKESIQIALEKGQITIADKYKLLNIDNYKHAQALLSLRVERNLQREQEINLQNIEANAKQQQDSLMMASKLEKEKLQFEYDLKVGLIEVQKKATIEVDSNKGEYALREKEMEVSGRIGQNQIQADAKIYVSDRQSKTKETETAATLQNSNVQKLADMEHEKEMAEEVETE
jgi:hypothetical protein